MKKSKGLVRTISATRSTSMTISVAGFGKTRRAWWLPNGSCCQLRKCGSGVTFSEYAVTGVREWGAGRRRTTCGKRVTGRSSRYRVTWWRAARIVSRPERRPYRVSRALRSFGTTKGPRNASEIARRSAAGEDGGCPWRSPDDERRPEKRLAGIARCDGHEGRHRAAPRGRVAQARRRRGLPCAAACERALPRRVLPAALRGGQAARRPSPRGRPRRGGELRPPRRRARQRR